MSDSIKNDTPDISKNLGNPDLMPLLGLISGFLIWTLDAYIDVYILGEEQTLVENIFKPEATELWMRTLIVCVLFILGLFARRIIQKHIALDIRLINYQKELEQLVADRTEELTKKSNELQIIANQDPLTHLANRRKFNEALYQEHKRLQRHNKSFSIILIDIDHFKRVNDQFGHEAGDKVIVNFAEILTEVCRCTDTVARWGGEEFIILSIETDLNQAQLHAQKILDAIRSTNFPDAGKLTSSIGISCCTSEQEAEEAINQADKALYKAKENGRDRIEC